MQTKSRLQLDNVKIKYGNYWLGKVYKYISIILSRKRYYVPMNKLVL